MKRTEQWSRFDVADVLATEADMVAYLLAALEDGDPALLTAALSQPSCVASRATLWKNCWLSVTPMPHHQVKWIGVKIRDYEE
ncbi:DNA-binding protein [Aeromonas veronii]|uniref:helix-turn-helix domain-containing transcriptional regulator n=1 Tax=Aeromonas veronii TaxID=654 RepID=UPI003BA104FD